MDEAKVVMYDSPEAARRCTVEGWVSRTGRFFGENESLARYDGSTHQPCSGCQTPITRGGWTVCPACRQKSEIQRYNARPRKAWDGVAWLYSEAADQWFRDLDEVEDALEEGETLEDFRLMICEPVTGRQLDYDFFSDELPEDGELPDELAEAVEVFNKAVIAAGTLSWSPGKFALDLSPAQPATEATP